MNTNSQMEKVLESSFTPKLTFDCIVNNKKIEAFYYGDTDESPIDHAIEVGFSDGYHSVFGCSEDFGWYDHNEKNPEYLTAIKDDLNCLLMLENSMWYSKFLIEEKNDLFNVYIFKKVKEGKGVVFSIYYFGDYKFDLKKKDEGWEWSTSRKINPETKDDEMVSRVASYLEQQAKVHRIF